MTGMTFAHLQTYLAQLSLLPEYRQIDFVRRANLVCAGSVKDDNILSLRDTAMAVVRDSMPSPSARPPERPLLWTRWSSLEGGYGIGLVLPTPHGDLLLLPEERNPQELAFEPSLPEETVTRGALIALFPEYASLFASYAPSCHYLAGVNVKIHPAPALTNGRHALKNATGQEVGWARVICGGGTGSVSEPDAMLSAATSVGDGAYQEDGIYVARFRTRDGNDVRVLVGADGLGGAEMGELASKAALLGAAAGVVEAAWDDRIPLADELFEDARTGLHRQIGFQEKAFGRHFDFYRRPDTVIAVIVVVDDLATIAAAGDFLVTYSVRDSDGSIRTQAYTDLDAADDHVVTATLGRGSPHLYRVRMLPDSWLCAGSDGMFGSLIADFKRRCGVPYRDETASPLPEQSLFYNLNLILRQTPPEHVSEALHEISMGHLPHRFGRQSVSYRGILPVGLENDNKSALAFYRSRDGDEAAAPTPELPRRYLPLNPVLPENQYVFERKIFELALPEPLDELFVGGELHPQNRPAVILPDKGLAPLCVRLYRENRGGRERIFVQKVADEGRYVIMDRGDRKIATLVRRGSRHLIRPGHLIQITPRTFFRFREE